MTVLPPRNGHSEFLSFDHHLSCLKERKKKPCLEKAVSAWEQLLSEKKYLSSSIFVFCGPLASLAKVFIKTAAVLQD